MGSIGSPSPINIAVIGAGVIGTKHASLVALSPDATLVSIVDPSPTGKKLAELYGAKSHPDVSALLEHSPRPSAAIICTPNDTHVTIGLSLAAAGIHLLIEKPFSTSYTEGTHMLQYCNENGIRICVGHHRRLNPYIAAAKTCLSSNKIGRILGVSGLWTSLKPQEYFRGVGAWRAGLSGGVVLINLIHEVDVLNFFVGPIVRVYAERAPTTRGHESEEGVAITLSFQNGAVGTFLALDNSPSPYNIEAGTGENPEFPFSGQDCYRIFGQKGTLSVPDNKLWVPEAMEKGWNSRLTVEALVSDHVDAYERQLANFIGVVKGEQEPSCSGEMGLQAVAVCEAIRNSLGRQTPVDVEIGF